MSQLRNKLMMCEIEDRLASANMLRRGFDESDSAYLLSLLAFELLLKLLHRKSLGCETKNGHKYLCIFNNLPEEVRVMIFEVAQELEPELDIRSRHEQILSTLSKNFVDMRYPYEKYEEDMTEDQYRAIGAEWVAQGADDEYATFTYYPRELTALTYALKQIVGMY